MSETQDLSAGCAPPREVIIHSYKGRDGNDIEIFNEELALASLLMNDAVSLNQHWWEENWPEEARMTFAISVNCNDIFAWGCADGEDIKYQDLRSVYEYWSKDPDWGIAVWCIVKRREMPQRPVEQRIRDAGLWDMDALKAEFALRSNYYDGMCHLDAIRKYQVYSTWAVESGHDLLPFDAGWWNGWKQFIASNPNWDSPEWQAGNKNARDVWRAENGWDEPSSQNNAAGEHP